MELRHLRYFLAVAEVLNFTKAAAQLRIAQPALSRQIQDLEDEIGADLLRRNSRGVRLTAEGKLFVGEAREILKRADEAVAKVRALARGHFGDLNIGYAASPTVEILPPALVAFQKEFPRVNVLLHDFSQRETIEGLQDGTLQLAVTPEIPAFESAGIAFESLRMYPFCIALAPNHRLARLKSISLEKVATEPLIGFSRKEYPDYYPLVERIFSGSGIKPRIALECDGASSLITAVETGRGIALTLQVFKHVTGKRLLYRPIAGNDQTISIGIARARNGDLTPAGEKFCEILRKTAKR